MILIPDHISQLEHNNMTLTMLQYCKHLRHIYIKHKHLEEGGERMEIKKSIKQTSVTILSFINHFGF